MARLGVGEWAAIPHLVHGFLSRDTRPYHPEGHDWSSELEAHDATGLAVVVARQVHGTRVESVSGPPAARPEADGLLTSARGVAVGVVTADCVPVLLVARRHRVAAAVHSGWRGTLGGIVGEAVAAVRGTGIAAGELEAAIGPAIGGCCYQIGPEVRVAFEERYGRAFVGDAFRDAAPRPYLDLRPIVRRQLEDAGLRPQAIRTVGPCTKCDAAYASVRRDGPRAGRQLSFIGWR
jgi:hypothetical protein